MDKISAISLGTFEEFLIIRRLEIYPAWKFLIYEKSKLRQTNPFSSAHSSVPRMHAFLLVQYKKLVLPLFLFKKRG